MFSFSFLSPYRPFVFLGEVWTSKTQFQSPLFGPHPSPTLIMTNITSTLLETLTLNYSTEWPVNDILANDSTETDTLSFFITPLAVISRHAKQIPTSVSPVTLSSEWSRLTRLIFLTILSVIGSVGNIFMISSMMIEDHLKKAGEPTPPGMSFYRTLLTSRKLFRYLTKKVARFTLTESRISLFIQFSLIMKRNFSLLPPPSFHSQNESDAGFFCVTFRESLLVTRKTWRPSSIWKAGTAKTSLVAAPSQIEANLWEVVIHAPVHRFTFHPHLVSSSFRPFLHHNWLKIKINRFVDDELELR